MEMAQAISNKEEGEMKQHISPPETHDLPVETLCPTHLCAWCLREKGITAGEESHGMCRKHYGLMVADYIRLKAARPVQKRGNDHV